MSDVLPEFVPAGMRTTFADDFSKGLSTTDWGTPYSQSFKSTAGSKASPSRVSVRNYTGYSALVIVPARDPKTGVVTTGGLMSKRFLPPVGGRYEVRARLTPGAVKCPLMLYPHAWPPEIDVFECTDPARKHFDANFHYADKSKAPKQSFALDITAYHTYGCTYRDGYLFWNIDGYNVGEAIATKTLPQMYPTIQTECAPQKQAGLLGTLYVRWVRLLEFV
jgi:hypothetical protein